MKIKLSKLWDSLHSSYWFVPTIMAISAIALALTTLQFDRSSKFEPSEKLGWIYTGGPEGARSLLSAVAGSMVSVAATAFSITIVALQLASANFGPRLLRNFMKDTGNQIVLGTFISTFIYCLFVLRTIRGEDYNVFVPQLSVTVGMMLAIASIGVLIFFIHHASTIIQASHVISQVSVDLDNVIDRLFPEKIGHSIPQRQQHLAEIPANFDAETRPIKASSSGYIQAIDAQELMKIACQHNLLLRLKQRPGKFVVKGSDLVIIWSQERLNRQLSDRINDVFILGNERTEQQDVEFPILQLVEIALRAISPAVNDPFTAIRCIDRLSGGLSRLAQRNIPSPYRYDQNNNLRVIAEPVTFADLTDAAFNQIRQYSTKDVAVTIRLLEAIAIIATYTCNDQDRAVLLRHADMIRANSKVSEECDHQDIEQRYQAAVQILESPP